MERNWKKDDNDEIIELCESGSYIIQQQSGNVFVGSGPIQVPMYDEQGKQIVGQENIRAEIARRQDYQRTNRIGSNGQQVFRQQVEKG